MYVEKRKKVYFSITFTATGTCSYFSHILFGFAKDVAVLCASDFAVVNVLDPAVTIFVNSGSVNLQTFRRS